MKKKTINLTLNIENATIEGNVLTATLTDEQVSELVLLCWKCNQPITDNNPMDATVYLSNPVKFAHFQCKPQPWPRHGDYVWELTSLGTIDKDFWVGFGRDVTQLANGNAFPTEAAAIRERDIRQALQRVRAWITENGYAFTPDWENKDQRKFSIYWDTLIDQFCTSWSNAFHTLGVLFHFALPGHAEHCINECDADLRIIAGIGGAE